MRCRKVDSAVEEVEYEKKEVDYVVEELDEFLRKTVEES